MVQETRTVEFYTNENHSCHIFLILMLSVQTPFGQVLKLPILVEHYLKHQQQDAVSLTSFLEDHYASDHKDADLPEDEQLPFKNIMYCNIGFAIVTSTVHVHVHAFADLPTAKKVIIPDPYSPQQHVENIFHPPRV